MNNTLAVESLKSLKHNVTPKWGESQTNEKVKEK